MFCFGPCEKDGDGLKTLRSQLLIWGFLLVVLPALFIVAFFFRYEERQIRESSQKELQKTIAFQAEFIERWTEVHASHIRRLATAVSARNREWAQMDNSFRSLALGARDFTDIFFINKDGLLLIETGGPKDLPENDRNFFDGLRNGKDYISQVQIGKQSGKPIIIFASPAYDTNGQFQGAAVGIAKMTTIDLVLERFRIGRSGEMYLLNRDGLMLTEARFNPELAAAGRIVDTSRLKLRVDSEGFRRGAAGGKGIAEYSNYMGRNVFGVYEYLPGRNWILLGEIEEAEVFAGLYSEMKAMSAGAAVLMFFAMGLIFLGSRRIIAPLHQLTEAAKAIREGAFDYKMESRFLSKGPLEMRELCYTFARMAEKINMQIRTMEKATDILARKEERWQLALQGNKDGIWDWNIITNELFLSERCREMFGFGPGGGPSTREELLASVHPEDLSVLKQKLGDHLEGHTAYYEAEYRRECKDGTYKWVMDRGQALWNTEGAPIRMAGSFTDIVERKQVEDKLISLSMKDSLTGLYNRAYFEEELQRLNDGRYAPIAVIVCDVDGLKLYNDSFGHLLGDRLIKAAAEVLAKTFRAGDVVARIGGDEFAVLLPLVTGETVEKAMDRLHASIEEINKQNSEFLLSISTGMAIGHSQSVNLARLFREADNNMYREKIQRSPQIRAAITQTVFRLLERRDYVEEGHTRRVAELCARLAAELGLSDERVNNLRLLAEYHDIGKVGIPDKILFKQGPLNASETKEMRRHSEIGHRIALSAADLSPISDLILKHQEWWDGQGYPLGISGEEIPMECRILAIADAYDSMTSERPYRTSISHAAAVNELKRCAGSQFDPFLVSVFVKLDPKRWVQKVV